MKSLSLSILLLSAVASIACSCFYYEGNFYKNATAYPAYSRTSVILVDSVYNEDEYNRYCRAILIDAWDSVNHAIGDTLIIEGQNGANCGDNMHFESGDTLVISTGATINYLSGDCGLHYLKLENGKNNHRSLSEIKAKIASGDTRINADYWHPFVPNKTMYFQQETSDSSAVINSFRLDSIQNDYYSKTLLFNYHRPWTDSCGDSISKALKMNIYYEDHSFDSLTYDYQERMINYDEDGNEFVINRLAKLNDKWESINNTFTITAFDTMTIFDELDSVKTINITNSNADLDVEFILSKNHGFIKWYPFWHLINQYSNNNFKAYELIGFDTLGYQQPTLQDYFNLNAGDVIYWENFTTSWDVTQGPGRYYYWKDSIVNATSSADSVTYQLYRISKQSYDIDSLQLLTKTYYKRDFQSLFSSPTNLHVIDFSSNDFDQELVYKSNISKEISNAKVIESFSISFNGLTIFKDDCQISMIMDIGFNKTYSTLYGIESYAAYSEGEDITKVIGSNINGSLEGTVTIPTTVAKELKFDSNIFPNPSKGEFSLVFEQAGKKDIKVYDLSGALILQKKLEGHYGVFDLDHQGIYILQIEDNQTISRKKLIVNH
jgi:hypothetical protein